MEDEFLPEVRGLLRQAAEMGPGYQGRRRVASATERDAVRNALIEFKQPVPAYMDATGDWVERRAKLFEAGDYPDKGVSLSEEDLRKLANGFDLPVPVLIEHAASPLELGFLTSVEAMGRELFGIVSLTPEANALVERSEARSLSIALSPSLDAIREVSLVRNPRVESARLFSGVLNEAESGTLPCSAGEGRVGVGGLEVAGQTSPPGAGGEETPGGSHPQPPPSKTNHFEGGGSDWRTKYEQLQQETRDREAERQIGEMVKTGKLTPAQVPFARAMLTADGAIEFDGESKPLRQLLIAMLERQPPHTLFQEQAPQLRQDASHALMLPEEAAFYERHFPGVSLESIASMR